MNKTLKKIIIFALAVVMLVSFVGCGENGGETTKDPQETVDKNTKKIAFTFDDGPHAPEEDLDTGIYPYTEYLLDRIETLGAKVTFFVLGDRAELYSGTIKRAVSLGCEIGSHSYSHPSPFDELSVSEFNSQINKAQTFPPGRRRCYRGTTYVTCQQRIYVGRLVDRHERLGRQ